VCMCAVCVCVLCVCACVCAVRVCVNVGMYVCMFVCTYECACECAYCLGSMKEGVQRPQMLLYGTIPCFYTVLYHAFIRYYTMLLYGTIPVLKYGTMCENHGNDHMNILLNCFN
jgi:hypothetical protein